MHVQTHALFGWCVGNLAPLTARQRLACLIAATIPDVDGIGILAGWDAYVTTHHVFGHCLLFGLISTAALWYWTRGRAWVPLLYLALFHSHLVMDYYGSGPGWPIPYLWPSRACTFVNWSAWDLSSWQNRLAFAVVFVWTIAIAVAKRRTPLELLTPDLDRKISSFLRRLVGFSQFTAQPAPADNQRP